MMKNKRQSFGSQFQYEPICSNKNKASTAFNSSIQYKRKQQKENNKQNVIQITQPLEPHLSNCQSKEFKLSRDSLNSRGSQPKLRQINLNQKQMKNENNFVPEENNLQFDRRLSLKCTASTISSNQKPQRMSMMPLRRESISAFVPQNFGERETFSNNYQSRNEDGLKKIRHEVKKQAIMTNLMHKLEHQDDLRSIIQSKLNSRDHRNISYFTEFSEENSGAMASKLKKCENQINYFKSIIKDMAKKITQLSQEKGSKQALSERQSFQIDQRELQSTYSVNLRKNDNPTDHCSNCERMQRPSLSLMRKTKEIGVQTNIQSSRPKQKFYEEGDFFENLQKTIKLLDKPTL